MDTDIKERDKERGGSNSRLNGELDDEESN